MTLHDLLNALNGLPRSAQSASVDVIDENDIEADLVDVRYDSGRVVLVVNNNWDDDASGDGEPDDD